MKRSVFHNSPPLITYRDRTSPVGYKLSVIPFANGEPVAAPNNNTATTDILANADNSVCPKYCFRPVGIAFDSQGRLFVSSDDTGEIYVVVRDQSLSSGTATATATKTSNSPSATATGSKSRAEKRLQYGFTGLLMTFILVQIGLQSAT